MINEAKMTELTQAEDMAYFRADLCIYSPESYSLEEKKICNDLMATSKAVLDTMREDFEQLPPDARAKLLDMLCASGVASLMSMSAPFPGALRRRQAPDVRFRADTMAKEAIMQCDSGQRW